MTTERRLKLAYGLLTGWQPKYIMDTLHVEKAPWHYTLPIVRPVLKAYDRISRVLPHDDEKAAFTLLEQFNQAITIPGGMRDKEVAGPEAVGADIAGSKGGMPRVRR
ncbi:MAG TPA: hypothetical protein VJT49_04410 [Amycolatopsis sp.]|uniref:hypothetical protein n=1 Tax=Amycolatopsis sp. TaxID=37632 RepID=UPI002B4922C0|nr:hypothetical protein [Amycolatopsis sp.]HKS44355.1 hypothetical protein [Amycolatopsis sp.]